MTSFLAISDSIWSGLLIALTGLVVAGTQWITSLRAEKTREQVKVDLVTSNKVTSDKLQVTADKLDGIATVADKTHTLVNSKMGEQLKLTARSARRIANLTNEAADFEAADLAEKLLSEHESRQSIVDAKETKERKL